MADQKRVLIVEDADENVVFLSQIMEDMNFQYRVAGDGTAALASMREKTPDLVLLDIMMPKKSGVAVFHEMKKDPALDKIPIIVITGASLVTGVDFQSGNEEPKESYADDFARGFGAHLRKKLNGMTPDAFIEKPIDPPLLMRKIRELMP